MEILLVTSGFILFIMAMFAIMDKYTFSTKSSSFPINFKAPTKSQLTRWNMLVATI